MAMEGGRTGLRAGRTGGRVCGVATGSVLRRGAPASRGNPARTVTCMAKKQNRVVVTLECTEQKGSGVPGISRYNTTKVRDGKGFGSKTPASTEGVLLLLCTRVETGKSPLPSFPI